MAIDLSTNYLGLRLRNPLVIAASPLTNEIHNLQRLEQAGAGAAVMASLFEEQIEHDELEVFMLHNFATDSTAESLSYFPDLEDYNSGPDGYLRHLEAAKKAVSIPIIGSLNGATCGGWNRFARLIQDAGADALELNIYYLPTDPTKSAEAVERRYLDMVQAVREQVRIPVAVKLGPFFSSLPHMVRRLEAIGVKGVVLFNRFYQPDLNLETLEVQPRLSLSHRSELLLPLRWIAILRGQTTLSLAATTGIHNADDVLKMLLVGADVTMMASVLIRHGPDHLTKVLGDMAEWLADKGYSSVEQLQGSVSQRHCADPAAFERANYMKTLTSFTRNNLHEDWKNAESA